MISTILTAILFFIGNLATLGGYHPSGDSAGWGVVFLFPFLLLGFFILFTLTVLPIVWTKDLITGVTLKVLFSIFSAIIVPVIFSILVVKAGELAGSSGSQTWILYALILVLLESAWVFFLFSHTNYYAISTVPYKFAIYTIGIIFTFSLSSVLNLNRGYVRNIPATHVYGQNYTLVEGATYTFPDFFMWYIGETKDSENSHDFYILKRDPNKTRTIQEYRYIKTLTNGDFISGALRDPKTEFVFNSTDNTSFSMTLAQPKTDDN